MLKLSVNELREKYIQFFVSKGHALIPSSSLIPENDPSALFTTAGMHPLAPYLLGEKHPAGTRLTNVQKCLRTGDIDRVGDDSHCTFFEMLGNWSLGDYFKEESIKYSYEFLTRELKIPSEKIAVSCFEGDSDIPKDEESAKIWRKLGIKEENIYFLSKEHNWWGPVGQTGPCGPDTEIFIIDDNKEPCGPNCSPLATAAGFWKFGTMCLWNTISKRTAAMSPFPKCGHGHGFERTAPYLTAINRCIKPRLLPRHAPYGPKTKKALSLKRKGLSPTICGPPLLSWETKQFRLPTWTRAMC